MAKELCITYLDESKISNHEINKHIDHYTIVSITSKRDYYLNVIEPNWQELREKNGIPDGMALHFTDIRYLLTPGRPHANYKTEVLNVFSESQSAESINYTKIHNFFLDVVNFIDEHEFIIHATGLKYNRKGLIRNIDNKHFKNSTYRPPYHAFKEHLNLMGVDLLSLSHGPYNHKNYLSTKLRFDGDVDLGERDDLREAYNHSISLGTRHFRPNLTKNIFDEVRFIGKDEVGASTGISHAGNEITDFITTIISRHIWNVKTDLIPIIIEGMPVINPIDIILSKSISKQLLKDNFF